MSGTRQVTPSTRSSAVTRESTIEIVARSPKGESGSGDVRNLCSCFWRDGTASSVGGLGCFSVGSKPMTMRPSAVLRRRRWIEDTSMRVTATVPCTSFEIARPTETSRSSSTARPLLSVRVTGPARRSAGLRQPPQVAMGPLIASVIGSSGAPSVQCRRGSRKASETGPLESRQNPRRRTTIRIATATPATISNRRRHPRLLVRRPVLEVALVSFTAS